jgi:DNA polymerase-3 subunit delta
MQAAVTDHARFNPFQVGDTLVAGDAARSLRVLRGLREEGEALPILVWSVAQACRRLPAQRAGPALRALGRIDTMVKGLHGEDPWVALEQLALQLAHPSSRP